MHLPYCFLLFKKSACTSPFAKQDVIIGNQDNITAITFTILTNIEQTHASQNNTNNSFDNKTTTKTATATATTHNDSNFI